MILYTFSATKMLVAKLSRKYARVTCPSKIETHEIAVKPLTTTKKYQ
jgi:hypothetical protein